MMASPSPSVALRVAMRLWCAAILIASLSGLQGRAAPVSASLPVLVSVANKPPVFVDAKADAGALRISNADGRLPAPDAFSVSFAIGEFNPAGRLLSESEGRVLSYSPLTGELSMFEAASGKTSVILAAGSLPTGLRDLELSARGIAVLVGPGDVTRLVAVQLPKTSDARAGWTDIQIPIEATDTAFSPTGLLVLSNKDRALYEIPISELPLNRAGQSRISSLEPRASRDIKYTKLLADLPGSPAAVAERREILYVSLGRDLLVIPKETRQLPAVVPIPGPLEQVDSLRVSEQYLLAADAARGRMAVVHRPVPVTISFQGDAADTIGRLARVFEILASYRLLPTRMIPVDRDSVFELMVAHQVLPKLRAGAISADVQKSLEGTLCRLNPSKCAPLRLERGSQLRVPAVPLNQRAVTTRVQLKDGTFADVLDARLYPEDRLSDGELLRKVLDSNRSLDQTLEGRLSRLNLIPWRLSPETSLQPGTPLVFRSDGRFDVVPSVGSCKAEPTTKDLEKQYAGLVGAMRTERADHLKPLLGLTGTIDVGVNQVAMVSASPDALKSCLPAGTAATHVVLDVLITDRVDLRAIDANAVVQIPDEAALQRAATSQPWISGTKRPEWTATLQGPVVLGFRALPLASSAAPDQAQARAALNAILDLQQGTLNVQVTGWEPFVVVPAKDLAPGAALKRIENARDPIVRISSLERSPSRATASSVDSSPAADKVLNDTERRQAGEKIRALIKYPAAAPNASSVVIVVAEKSKSVDLHHPDFRRQDGFSIWSKVTADGRGVALDDFPAPTTVPPAIERDFKIDDDHGTHVAGLLAGVGWPLGLAPEAGLFLVPMEKQADQIRSLLEFAADNIPASIANFSQVFPIDAQIQDQIGGGIDLLADRLLVVAAVDNKSRALSGTLLLGPIGWSDGPNVIGVAAADENRQILATSDSGKRYVQLLAIGKEVLSLADKGAYARTSGASQAAPQVAAAAALLAGAGQRDPVQVKARLIATADWDDKYEDKVWAGFLNMDRAVSNLLSDVLVRTNLPNKLSVALHTNVKLQLKRSAEYAPDSPTPNNEKSDGEIEWSKILRIVKQTWLTSSKRDAYRVVYLASGNQVSILKNVEFKPNQSFMLKRCVRLDAQEPTAAECAPLDPAQIEDYVAKFPGMRPLRFVRQVRP